MHAFFRRCECDPLVIFPKFQHRSTDLFRGKNVPVGKYSLLVRATFQSREATLTDAQITIQRQNRCRA